MPIRKEIQPTLDNDKILSEVFADKVKQARKKKFPSAEDILSSLGDTRVKFR